MRSTNHHHQQVGAAETLNFTESLEGGIGGWTRQKMIARQWGPIQTKDHKPRCTR